MNERRCPDCGVRMESAQVRSNDGARLVLDTGRRDGMLGKLGISETERVESVCCPECGLVRLYADLE
ncbi:hypothetical protein ACLI4Z_03495 [Natrialbaceae archaeon A-arb3/5]